MKPLEGLLAAIRAATTWLAAAEVPHAIIGGVAASLHGKPRVTKDVDLVALAEDRTWSSLLDSARKHNIQPRIQAPLDFARTTRVLLLVHKPSGIEIDLSFGMLPFERGVVERAEPRTVKKVSFALATAEDIVVMKALALRPRDIADIEGILESVPNLDLQRVRSTVSQLSQALEGEDHLARLETVVQQVHKRR
ncbi:MAG TPA: nucleotidyltransferase [Polyangiaceae bacterium]